MMIKRDVAKLCDNICGSGQIGKQGKSEDRASRLQQRAWCWICMMRWKQWAVVEMRRWQRAWPKRTRPRGPLRQAPCVVDWRQFLRHSPLVLALNDPSNAPNLKLLRKEIHRGCPRIESRCLKSSRPTIPMFAPPNRRATHYLNSTPAS